MFRIQTQITTYIYINIYINSWHRLSHPQPVVRLATASTYSGATGDRCMRVS